jgi:hypothetical protein
MFRVIAPVDILATVANAQSIVRVPGEVTTVDIIPDASIRSWSPGILIALGGSVYRPCVVPVVKLVRVMVLLRAVPAA